MVRLDSAKDRALSYFAELRETAAIRQFFAEIIIGRNGELVQSLGYDPAAKARLREAVKLKATPPTALYRGLYVQASSIFEAYVRDLSSIAAESKTSKFSKYSELPEPFRHHHIYLSGQILQQMKTGTLHGQKFNFEQLIRSLGQCFSDADDFSIMSEIFTSMMGNATPDRLEKLFVKIGLPHPFDPGVGQNSAVKRVFGETRQASAAKLAREKLDEIVGIRNTLVHGDLSITVQQSDLDLAMDYFEAMIEALDSIVKSVLS
mgnify:CR=1 FL=1